MPPQQFDFDRRFQSKLVRALFQAEEEAREILENLEPTMFDTAPMRWTIKKLKWSWFQLGAPASIHVLEHEAIRDANLGLIRDEHVGAYVKQIARLKKKVPDRGYLLDRAYEYVRYVSMREFLIDTADALQKRGEIDWEAISQSLDRQRQFGDRSEGSLGQDFFSDTENRIKRRKNFEVNGVPTGIDVIDEKMRHRGLPPRQLGVVIAPPGRGKTAMLCYMSGSAVLYGYNSLYISCELDEDVIAERHDARFSGVRLGRLTKKPRTLRRCLKEIQKANPNAGLRIKYFPSGQLTMSQLRSYLQRLEAAAFYPDVIFIDYVDNMSLDAFRARGGGDSDYSPLGRLYVATRGLAGEKHVSIWTASQSNRMSLDKKEIGLGDLADSFKKAAIADVMVAVAQTKAEMGLKVARLCMAKNRNGKAGTVDTVQFNTGKVDIADL